MSKQIKKELSTLPKAVTELMLQSDSSVLFPVYYGTVIIPYGSTDSTRTEKAIVNLWTFTAKPTKKKKKENTKLEQIT